MGLGCRGSVDEVRRFKGTGWEGECRGVHGDGWLWGCGVGRQVGGVGGVHGDGWVCHDGCRVTSVDLNIRSTL